MPYNPHFLSENQTCCRRRFIPCWRSRSPSPNKGLLLQHIHSTKKRWWPETSYQPKKAQLSREVRTLQDGDSPYSEIPSLKGRLDGQGRLERCFLYLPIAKQFHHLLLFKANAESFQFLCLPYGLCTAPRVFTKVLKPAVELLRSIGIKLMIYMDDMLLMANSKQLIREQTYTALFLLENHGFVNNKKSVLTPCQQMEFLGMTVDSQSMALKLPGEKIKKIRAEAQHLLANPSIQA